MATCAGRYFGGEDGEDLGGGKRISAGYLGTGRLEVGLEGL